MDNNTSSASIGEARERLRANECFTGQSIRRVDEIAGRFESFVGRGFDAEMLSDVTVEHVEAFVKAKGSTGDSSVATIHVRRSSLRMLFRIARIGCGLFGDPTSS